MANPSELCNILSQNKLQRKDSPMAIISQRQLFSWEEIENMGDLERFSLLLEYLPDEELMKILEAHRRNGRNGGGGAPHWCRP